MAEQVQGVPTPPPPPLQLQHKQDNSPTTGTSCLTYTAGQQIVHLNWSHFKPEFSGKPDEDQEPICFAPMTG